MLPTETPRRVLEDLDLEANEFKAWAKEVGKGRLYELDGDTIIYHRTDDKGLYLNASGSRENPDKFFLSYFNNRMGHHWENRHHGDGNYYGTGIYAHADPFGASQFGDQILAITLPKGSRVIMDRGYLPALFRGCSRRLDSNMGRHSECKTLLKAALRSLKVTAIIFSYDYYHQALDCSEPLAFLMVDDHLIGPNQVTGYFQGKKPGPLASANNATANSVLFEPNTLGCGIKRIPVVSEPDLDYPLLATGCKHQGPSPLNQDLLGTLSSMLEVLQ